MAGYQIGDVCMVVKHSLGFMVSGMHLLKKPTPKTEKERIYSALRNC